METDDLRDEIKKLYENVKNYSFEEIFLLKCEQLYKEEQSRKKIVESSKEKTLSLNLCFNLFEFKPNIPKENNWFGL